MINHSSLKAIGYDSKMNTIIPHYEAYSFAHIPTFILSYFNALPSSQLPIDCVANQSHHQQNLVVFFIDGFGWSLFERLHDRSTLLKRFTQDGIVSAITSQFPSTTAAHVTTFHTGKPVFDTGIFEWYMYEPIVGRIIEPITLLFGRKDIAPKYVTDLTSSESMYPFSTIFMPLSEHGITSSILLPKGIASSPYSQIMNRGGTSLPYDNPKDAVLKIENLLTLKPERNLIYVYIDILDYFSHRHGPYGPPVYAAAFNLFSTLEHLLFKSQIFKDAKPLTLFCADHGLIHGDPSETMYLDKIIPNFLDYLRCDVHTNELCFPVGSCRDLFLLIKPDSIEKVTQLLNETIGDRALILSTAKAIEMGIWGSQQSTRLIERIGDVVILPHPGNTVWISENDRWSIKFKGHHGGLSPEEMVTPFISWQG